MIRRPPRSTPFPTRRSSDLGPTPIPVVLIAPRDAPSTHDLAEGFAAIIQMPDPEGALAEVIGRLLGAPRRTGAPRPTDEDRKSTRLNSSHQISSYAGFCLQK